VSFRFGVLLSAAPDFGKLALGELARVAPAAASTLLGPGLWGVGDTSFAELCAVWRKEPPVFVRHIAPIDVSLPLSGEPGDLENLARGIAEHVAARPGSGTFSVQTRALERSPAYTPYELTSAIAARIEAQTGLTLDVKAPEQVLSLLLHGDQAYVGWSATRDNLSSWAGGVHRFAREPEQLSRAEFKLLEALQTFELRLPPEGRALDLGAAPGGWTRILAARGQRVTAVDPARLHPSLLGVERIQHVRTTAEEFLGSRRGPFDVILDDIRKDARESALLMQQCASLLAPEGFALLTLKLRHERRAEQLAAALGVLRASFGLCRARHLFHNRSEVTVYLRRAPVST
jgi:23S rRNA (cytidine2498-2'-O)-methyltransferase